MFKKPLAGLKTSAPLRSSDRRKLKQRIISTFSISSEEGDVLVPEGLLSIKFSTHLDEPGVRVNNRSYLFLLSINLLGCLFICRRGPSMVYFRQRRGRLDTNSLHTVEELKAFALRLDPRVCRSYPDKRSRPDDTWRYAVNSYGNAGVKNPYMNDLFLSVRQKWLADLNAVKALHWSLIFHCQFFLPFFL